MKTELPEPEYYARLYELQYKLQIADLQRDRNYWYNVSCVGLLAFLGWKFLEWNGWLLIGFGLAWCLLKFRTESKKVRSAQAALDAFEENYTFLCEGY